MNRVFRTLDEGTALQVEVTWWYSGNGIWFETIPLVRFAFIRTLRRDVRTRLHSSQTLSPQQRRQAVPHQITAFIASPGKSGNRKSDNPHGRLAR